MPNELDMNEPRPRIVVKLAAGGDGDVLVRHERLFPGDDPTYPPPPAAELVTAFARLPRGTGVRQFLASLLVDA